MKKFLCLLAIVYAFQGCGKTPFGDGPPSRACNVDIEEPSTNPILNPRYRNGRLYEQGGFSYKPLTEVPQGYSDIGMASWYGRYFDGRKTANGEIFDTCAYTAAHKTLPLPSLVRVTHRTTGRSVVVRVNDRGPFYPGRIIDLSYAAAKKIGIDRSGIGPVTIEVIGKATKKSNAIQTRGLKKSVFQLGAFSDPQNAIRAREKFLTTFPSAKVVPNPNPKSTAKYLVHVDPSQSHYSREKIIHILTNQKIPYVFK